MYYVPRIHI